MKGNRVEPLYLIATIKPRADRADEARVALHKLMALSKAEPGCEMYDLVENPNEAGTWLMLEKWTSREHWDAHMVTEHNAAFGKVAAEVMIEPITLGFFKPV